MRRKETEESRVTYSNQKGRDTLNVKWQVSNMPRSHHTTFKVVTSLSCSHYIPFRLVFVSPAVIWRSHTTGPIGANTRSRPGDVTRKRRRQNLQWNTQQWKKKETAWENGLGRADSKESFIHLNLRTACSYCGSTQTTWTQILKSLCVFIYSHRIGRPLFLPASLI